MIRRIEWCSQARSSALYPHERCVHTKVTCTYDVGCAPCEIDILHIVTFLLDNHHDFIPHVQFRDHGCAIKPVEAYHCFQLSDSIP